MPTKNVFLWKRPFFNKTAFDALWITGVKISLFTTKIGLMGQGVD
jgi:hypothetical protein